MIEAESGALGLDREVKLAVYRATAEEGRPPAPAAAAARVGISLQELEAAYGRLAQQWLLVLEPDGLSIRMAPPFSGVPTQHQVRAEGVDYFANCAWDALGIPAALQRPAEVRSRCEQSGEILHLDVGVEGPAPSEWLFHSQFPAAQWWKDIVFT